MVLAFSTIIFFNFLVKRAIFSQLQSFLKGVVQFSVLLGS